MYEKLLSIDQVDFSKLSDDSGERIVPAVIVDRVDLALGKIGCVRMVGFMNRPALEATIETELATFYSRSRQTIWQKGESSGNVLAVLGIYVDCDDDTLLVEVDANGPTCHSGTDSCFER